MIRHLRRFSLAIIILSTSWIGAAHANFYGNFMVAGKGGGFFPYETFVFFSNDYATLQVAYTAVALHSEARVAVRIAAGGNGVNGNYFTGGYPNQIWGWRVTEVLYIETAAGMTPPSLIGLPPAAYNTTPSDIDADPAGWIAANGDIIFLQNFRLVRSLKPGFPKAAALNSSLRGWVGPNAEQSIIGGISVVGNSGQGLDVVIRAMGPSLAPAGISNPLGATKLLIYNSRGDMVYANSGWQHDWRADEFRTRWPWLTPSNPAESAVLINLLPGPYTVRVESVDGSAGVALIEFYNADPPDFPAELAR